MSQPPTDPRSWSLGDQWRQSEGQDADGAGSGRAPIPGQGDGRWSAPNGARPQPRVYGRATATPSHGAQPPAQQVYGQGTAAAPYGQPPSATPYGQPTSAAPYGQPTSAAPYGQPTSAMPYGQPTSAAPYGQPSPAAPYGQPPSTAAYEQPASTPPAYQMPQPALATAAGWKRPGPLPMVALVAGLLFVLSGVMTVLFFMKSAELSRAEEELRSEAAQMEQVRRELQTAKDRATKTQQDLTGTKNARDELERQKQVISRCLNLLGEASRAASNGDRSAYNDAIKKAEPVCKEADRYL